MAKTQYVIYEHGYKVAFSGFAYVEADSEEEAKKSSMTAITSIRKSPWIPLKKSMKCPLT